MKDTFLILGALSIIPAWILGYLTPILGVSNFIWMLVKDETLFSWWWVLLSGVGFVVSVIFLFIGIILKN